MRVAQHHVGTLAQHIQEVCGLQWSPDGQLLASGGNDNEVNIWDSTLGMSVAPVHTFTNHQAAVKVRGRERERDRERGRVGNEYGI